MPDQNVPQPPEGVQPTTPQQPIYQQPAGQQQSYQQSYQQPADQQPFQQSYQQPTYQQPPQQAYQQSPQQVYQQPAGPNLAGDAELTVGNWMVTILLMCLPIVNIVMLFVWGFSDATPFAKKNWAKAQLIWMAIGIGISIIIVIITVVAGVSLSNSGTFNGYSV